MYQASAQTKSKPSEIEETPQKYGTTDRIKHLFHSISNLNSFIFFIFLKNVEFLNFLTKKKDLEDKEKIGELKEIEQEEIYINMLKEQREKVFYFLFFLDSCSNKLKNLFF